MKARNWGSCASLGHCKELRVATDDLRIRARTLTCKHASACAHGAPLRCCVIGWRASPWQEVYKKAAECDKVPHPFSLPAPRPHPVSFLTPHPHLLARSLVPPALSSAPRHVMRLLEGMLCSICLPPCTCTDFPLLTHQTSLMSPFVSAQEPPPLTAFLSPYPLARKFSCPFT